MAYLTKQSGKELDYKRLTDKEKILFDAAKEVEIGNLEGSNAIRIITDEKELDKIRRDFPSRIMPSRFLLTKKAGEVGEDWKAKARWILLGQLERYAPTRVVKATLGSEALDDALAELEWIRALWCETLDPASCILDGTRLGDNESVLAVRQTDNSESIHVTDAKALFDLLQRRSGNAGHCRRAQIDVSVICISARTLRVTTHWVPGEHMIADPLTKRCGNSQLMRRILRLAQYALSKSGFHELQDKEHPPKDVKPFA